ncbi:MAG: hypothetical protein QXL91_02085 [Candidatus Bathyarchaeia archaeon]
MDKAILSIPYGIRATIAAVMFAEAALLAYALATLFPLELHIYMITVLTLALAWRYIPLARRLSPELRLKKTLERLKKTVGLGHELEVKWIPNHSHMCSGEVKGNIIYIYDTDLKEAEETLVHEYVEWLIAQTSKPYLELLNTLIRCRNEEAYKRRHAVAEALSKLITKTLRHNAKTLQKSGKHNAT